MSLKTLSNKRISYHLFIVYVGIFFYTLSKHFGIMDLSFQEKIGEMPKYFSLAGCGILFIGSIISEHKIKKKAFFILGGSLILIIVNLIPTGYKELLYIFVIVYSIRNTNIDSVVMYTYKCVALLTIINVILVCVGFLPDYVSVQTDRIRHCLGFSSWTVLPFQYMSLVMGFTLFSKKPIKWYVLAAFEGCNYLIYKLTDLSTAFLLLTAFLVLFVLCFNKKHVKSVGKKHILCSFPWIMAGFSFLLDYLYLKNIPFMNYLDIVLNGRLRLNKMAYTKYGIHFFSTEVKWVGIEDVWNYFVVDNAYVNALITYGITGLILVLIVYSFLLKYCIDKNRKLLLYIIIIDLIKNVMFNRLLSYQQTIYIFYIAELLSSNRNRLLQIWRKQGESFNS